jgi:hypothetical protein
MALTIPKPKIRSITIGHAMSDFHCAANTVWQKFALTEPKWLVGAARTAAYMFGM